jgi:hypothetical protein
VEKGIVVALKEDKFTASFTEGTELQREKKPDV